MSVSESATAPIYASFWRRFGATIIDSIIFGAILIPVLMMIYGDQYWSSDELIMGPADFLVSYVLPAFVTVILWNVFAATPGKMILKVIIVREKDLGPMELGQSIGRYLLYYLSAIPLGLGFLWVAFDPKKQGWHDKIAGTVVIHRPR